MLHRGPDYHYKPEDTEFIKKETMKDQAVIQHWARQFRWRVGSNFLPAGMTAEEYLKASPESLSDKVIPLKSPKYWYDISHVTLVT